MPICEEYGVFFAEGDMENIKELNQSVESKNSLRTVHFNDFVRSASNRFGERMVARIRGYSIKGHVYIGA